MGKKNHKSPDRNVAENTYQGQFQIVKHHYVPQFLLRRWTNETGRLHCFSVRNGRLVCSERAPEYTGFEKDLYGILANALGVGEDHLEKRLFGPIDSNAARVLDKLEQHRVLTEDEHIAWTFFLSSLRIRQPDVLRFLRNEGMTRLRATLAARDRQTLPEGWPPTEEWFNRNHPGAMEAMTLTSWLPKMILHDGVMDAFANMRWWLREFDAGQPALLLSDLPIHWEGGFTSNEFMIQLPLGPRRVFFGARSAEIGQILDRIPPGELIRRVNLTTIAAAADRIWAYEWADAAAFIEANLDKIGVNVVAFDTLAPAFAVDP
jgi:hypothetical protein